MPEEKKEKPSVEGKEVNKELSVDELKKELEECRAQKNEYLSGWQRERADFLNYKREEMERIGQLAGFVKEELILEMLPIMDNFEVIEKNLPENFKKDKNIEGLMQVKIQFADFLKQLEVEEIKSIGEKFDPHFHEIVEEVEIKDNGSASSPQRESGTIIEEVQKGYMINSRLLRPARVKAIK